MRRVSKPHELHLEYVHGGNCSPPKRAAIPVTSLSHLIHARVNPPRSGGTEWGTSAAPSLDSSPPARMLNQTFRVLKIRGESDHEIQNLSARLNGFCESESSKSLPEASEVPMNVWHKCRHLEMIYPKLLGVRERGEVMQGVPIKMLVSELGKVQADTG